MNVHVRPGRAGSDRTAGIIKLAILAVGGQGGGVVTNWIVALAEASGYTAQSTSVPGVAQRTGATIYYIEMVPQSERTPILSLMPAAGDVDIVLAAELMEAGRAIQRGFVTPNRTTLIASSHRSLAVSEKIVPGTGLLDDEPILEAARDASAAFYAANLEDVAVKSGSVISASLFGALAAAEVLPFPRSAFEDTIRRGKVGVEPSLRAFAAAYEVIKAGEVTAVVAGDDAAQTHHDVAGPQKHKSAFEALLRRVGALPASAREMAHHGLVKVVDFQDVAYGGEYLDKVEALAAYDHHDETGLVATAAKYVANAMAYDDVIRVADLKTRATRTARVRQEVGVRDDQVLMVTEYMHPRAAEICGLMPASLGAYVERRPKLYAVVDRLFNRGRRVRTDRLRGFLPLYLIAGLRPFRRRLLRHTMERAHWEAWLATVHRVAKTHPQLAREVLACRRLIKGYSDTHAWGLSKFDKVLDALPLLETRSDGADWLRRLKEAALADEAGDMLDGALKTVASLDTPASLPKTRAA
ncbi:MAG: indolepyruvate oxidoreductase subunit beta family protein [Pseudomonadota bacterium]